MPITGNYAVTGSVQGRVYQVTTTVNTNAALQIDETCLVAEAGSLTTRTNNTTGNVTLTVKVLGS